MVNQCQNVSQTDWNRVTAPLFAFHKVAGSKGETQGVGIGISTAGTLAQALQGELYFSVDTEKHSVTSILRVRVGTELTNLEFESRRKKDLESSRSNSVQVFRMNDKYVPPKIDQQVLDFMNRSHNSQIQLSARPLSRVSGLSSPKSPIHKASNDLILLP